MKQLLCRMGLHKWILDLDKGRFYCERCSLWKKEKKAVCQWCDAIHVPDPRLTTGPCKPIRDYEKALEELELANKLLGEEIEKHRREIWGIE